MDAMWEYRIETADAWPEGAGDDTPAGLSAEALNRFGSQGWELVTVLPIAGHANQGQASGTHWLHYVFKRRVPDPLVARGYAPQPR